jgi:hypothetical protein
MKKELYLAAIVSCFVHTTTIHAETASDWDSTRYIRISEVKPEMEAYCLTVLEKDKIERFSLKILSIVKQARAAQDMILVVGTDERFKNLGAIHGCSGSPVYIDGRMAGALAAGWDGSLEPLYMVTPIENMLSIGQGEKKSVNLYNKTSCVEFSAPLNLDSIGRKAIESISRTPMSSSQLPIATNLSTRACEVLNESMTASGFVLMQADNIPWDSSESAQKPAFAPGGVLSVPLCSGDIRMAAIGTVTEVVGDKVYGFGHAFTGIGEVELPMAAGIVYTVVATRQTSIKLAGASEAAGTLRYDQETGVAGIIGPIPKRIDLTVNVKRWDAVQDKSFHCQVARDRNFTPVILQNAIVGAALYQGDLPPEHNIKYHCMFNMEMGRQIDFSGVSSGQSVMDMAKDIFALSAALLNNPFQPIYPDKIVMDVQIAPDNLLASLWEAKIAENIVRPGDTVKIHIALKGFRSEPKIFAIELKISDNCPDGKYPLQVCGADAYQAFWLKASPQRFTVVDAESLLAALNRVLNIEMDRIYVCLPIDQSGLTLRNAELPNLPMSKMLLLADDKHMLPAAPYQNFIETSIPTGLITSGSTVIELTVDKNKQMR